MEKKVMLLLFTLMFLTLLPYMTTYETVSLSPETIIQVPDVIVPVCKPFYINITITNVPELWMYNLTLHYDTFYMDAIEASAGYILDHKWQKNITNIDHDLGNVQLIAWIWNWDAQAAKGNGTLATIKFQCIWPGLCHLTLINVSVKDKAERDVPNLKIKNGTCDQRHDQTDPIEVSENYTLCYPLVFHNDAFIIKASNVVLDLNGYEIEPYLGKRPESGILCEGKNNIIIKNGTIKGFQRGIIEFLTTRQ